MTPIANSRLELKYLHVEKHLSPPTWQLYMWSGCTMMTGFHKLKFTTVSVIMTQVMMLHASLFELFGSPI